MVMRSWHIELSGLSNKDEFVFLGCCYYNSLNTKLCDLALRMIQDPWREECTVTNECYAK